MRNSSQRWLTLSILLNALERCMEANARLDARTEVTILRGRPRFNHSAESGAAVGARIDLMSQRISREMNRLTVERLQLDLVRKQQIAS